MADDDRDRLVENLNRAWPIGSGYVTRTELAQNLERLETKIVNSELRLQKWVLGGCIAIILSFGGGYVSLVSKLDRLSEALPVVTEILEGRRVWMQRQDQRDDQQDRALQGISPRYHAMPYVETPK